MSCTSTCLRGQKLVECRSPTPFDRIEHGLHALVDPADLTRIQIDRFDSRQRKVTPECTGAPNFFPTSWSPDSHRQAVEQKIQKGEKMMSKVNNIMLPERFPPVSGQSGPLTTKEWTAACPHGLQFA